MHHLNFKLFLIQEAPTLVLECLLSDIFVTLQEYLKPKLLSIKATNTIDAPIIIPDVEESSSVLARSRSVTPIFGENDVIPDTPSPRPTSPELHVISEDVTTNLYQASCKGKGKEKKLRISNEYDNEFFHKNLKSVIATKLVDDSKPCSSKDWID